MTDGLLDLGPVFSAAQEIGAKWAPYLVAMLGVYLGLFLVGLVVEAMRSSRAGGRSDV